MAENVAENRQTSPAPDVGRIYSVGCLPIILAWFLLDLIGKAVIWSVASLFDVQFAPTWPKIVLVGSLAVIGLPIAVLIVFWLYLITSDLVHKIFHRDKKGKSRPTETN